jgi:hypothetical protein
MHAAAHRRLLRLPLPLRPPCTHPHRRLTQQQQQRACSSSGNKGGGGGGGSEDAYLEAWQRRQIRPPAFYEAEGRARRWMYTVDLQGRLFYEQMPKKDLTSCLKNDKVGGLGRVDRENKILVVD